MKKIFSVMLLFATVLFASCEKDESIPAIGVDSINLNHKTASISIGQTIVLNATIMPETAPMKDVSWITCDNAIATVVQNGATGSVKGIAAGEAVITVISADGGKMASCTITVKPE